MSRQYEHEQFQAIQAVRQATRLCLAVRGSLRPEVLDKTDKSPVTVADFGSQAVICRVLGITFPGDPIIAEEDAEELDKSGNAALLDEVVALVRALRLDDNGTPTAAEIRQWINRGRSSQYSDRFWTVDPIDGTKGFLRNEQYAVALALIVEGQVAVAALSCPNLPAGSESAAASRGLIFAAARGQGAIAVPLDQEVEYPGEPVRVQVSQRTDPASLRFCESVESGHSAHGDAAAIAARMGIVMPPVRMDSQAKYCIVARGDAEIYLRMPTRADYREKIWDHAAGALIVEEAGGTVTDVLGRPLDFRHGRELSANRGVIVTNGRPHTRVLETLRALGLGAENPAAGD
jgi:3'(2'), 5'-bisphosphate nucleotidase